jgi:hypothetical protein
MIIKLYTIPSLLLKLVLMVVRGLQLIRSVATIKRCLALADRWNSFDNKRSGRLPYPNLGKNYFTD